MDINIYSDEDVRYCAGVLGQWVDEEFLVWCFVEQTFESLEIPEKGLIEEAFGLEYRGEVQ